MSIIAPYVKTIFAGIKPSWRRLLLSKDVRPSLDKCLELLDRNIKSKGVTKELVSSIGLHNYIRPTPDHILEAFKYFDVNNLRAIIVGQDPYLSHTDAHGLSFSSKNGAKPPPSLKKIYSCLEHSGYITPTNEANLTNWVKQGILLINAFLTRTPNIIANASGVTVQGNGGSTKNCLHPFWEEFSGAILTHLTKTASHDIFVVLWGNEAKKLKHYIVAGQYVKVLEWGHPSPLNTANSSDDNPGNFKYCDHFKIISRRYPTIQWSPEVKTTENLSDQFWLRRVERNPDSPHKVSMYNETSRLLETNDPNLIYDDGTDTEENLRIREYIEHKTVKKAKQVLQEIKETQVQEPKILKAIMVCVDGGCSGNHIKDNPNAIGAYGVWFAPFLVGKPTASGEIKKNGVLSKCIMLYDKNKDQIIETEEFTRATNQRAELTAVIVALQELCKLDLSDVDKIIIVTDSLQYIVSWLGSRVWQEYAKDKKFTKVINRDLVTLMARYLWNLGRKFKPGCSFEAVQDLIGKKIFIQHINSHLSKAEYARLSGEYKEYSGGNSMADTLCNEIINSLK
jgi:uracil-DNA glycosylase